MTIEIVSCWDADRVLYKAEGAADIRAAVEGAGEKGADLRDADLRGADLRDADLRGANLRDADLRGANLRGANLWGADLRDANLRGANLWGADLRDANLWGADLWGANLRGADLRDADLRGANLRDADLRGADLRGANLRGANLWGAKGISPARVTDLLILLDQPDKIRAYKLVTSEGCGPFNGGITYRVGESYEVSDADTDPDSQCGVGINLATLPWCLANWREGYRVLLCEFGRKDVAAIPTATDGKLRVHRCKVIREVDLEPIFAAEREPAPTEEDR